VLGLPLLATALLAASCPRKSEPTGATSGSNPSLSSSSSSGQAQLGVVITADLRGYLEPCGCSEHMLGGIDRAAAQSEALQKSLGAVLSLNAGDSLFQGPSSDDAHAQQDLLKARTLIQAMAEMQTGAFAVGPRDHAQGDNIFAGLGAPFPLLGAPGSEADGSAVIDRGGFKIGVASGADANSLVQHVGQARSRGAEWVVALAQMPMKDLVPIGPQLKQAGADLAVAGHQATDLDGDDERAADASIPVLSVKNRGRSLISLELHRVPGASAGFATVASDQSHLDELHQRDDEIESLKKRAHEAQGALKEAMEKKIAEKQAQRDAFAAQKPQPPAGRSWWSYHFVELSDEKPSSEKVHALIDRYTDAVGQLNLAFAKEHGKSCPAAKPGEPSVVGNAVCIGCHADPGDVWEKTEHAHAYKTLEAKHKQYDLDCVRCHVLGSDKPGGVCRVDQVKDRDYVGCESCHGPGSLHADDPDKIPPLVIKPSEQNCRVCHTPENSTNFDFATYLPKILGPGHGKPMAKK
jgi:hypothetical protein